MLGILAIQALVSFAIIRYFLVHAPEHGHWWKTKLAPVIGGSRADRRVLPAHQVPRGPVGGRDNWFIKYLPWFVLLMFLGGIAAALYWRSANKEKYAAIGRFVHEDA